MMVALLVALALYCVGATVFIVKMNRQLNEQESALSFTLLRVYNALRIMRELDDKQMFEDDDEVGEVFRQLANITYDMLDVTEDTHRLVGDRLRDNIESE